VGAAAPHSQHCASAPGQASDAVDGVDFGDGTLLSNRNTGAGRVQKSAEKTTYLRIASLFGSLCETSVCMRMFGRALKFEIRSCATTFSPHGLLLLD
jgi:hypothetical protein